MPDQTPALQDTDPMLVTSMRTTADPRATVRIVGGTGTTVRGFLTEYDAALEAARQVGATEVVRTVLQLADSAADFTWDWGCRTESQRDFARGYEVAMHAHAPALRAMLPATIVDQLDTTNERPEPSRVLDTAAARAAAARPTVTVTTLRDIVNQLADMLDAHQAADATGPDPSR